eukprot:262204_1
MYLYCKLQTFYAGSMTIIIILVVRTRLVVFFYCFCFVNKMMKRAMNGTTIRHRMPQQTTKEKPSQSSTNRPVTTKGAIISIVLCSLMFLYYFFINSRTDINRTLHVTSSAYKTFQIKDVSQDTIEDINIEYMYEFPSGVDIQQANGIVFLAHGCSHSATDFFEASETCTQCLGLPEERALIKAFLKKKYIVITISSQNRMSKCWNRRTDTDPVKQILLHFKEEFNIGALSVYAFGASSGGSFVGSLASNNELVNAVGLAGVMVQISVINIGFDDMAARIFVPVLFIPMRKDGRTSGIVKREAQLLKKNENISTVCWVDPTAIDTSYFYRKIGGELTLADSEKMQQALKENGYLDEKDFLAEDPRQSDWRYVIQSAIGQERLNKMFDGLVADESAISESMNVAFALHEIAAQCVHEMFDFMKATQKVNL